MLTELHNHLYGSFSVETLFWIGKNNPFPRWKLFIEPYNQVFRKNINSENFFSIYDTPNKLSEIYYFNKPGPFSEFQAHFNLIIALSTQHPDEIRECTRRTLLEHEKEGIGYIEYRLMYSPLATKEDYKNKTIACCMGLHDGEKESRGRIQGRLAISLHRNIGFADQYNTLKELMTENDIVNKYLVGIDFCHIEEGFPPKHKKDFFKKIIYDNLQDNKSALSILYHVAESFNDKTPQSAIRWIIESSEYGANRLGHCIALGIDPEIFKEKIFIEKVSERIDQIHFLLKHYEEIRSFGKLQEINILQNELRDLKNKSHDFELSFTANNEFISELKTIQDFGIHRLENSSSVIECCPTSNMLIGMIPKIELHPLKRFLNSKLKITIGADDPGIFNTNVEKEYSIAAKICNEEKLKFIKENSYNYRSEILSGRVQSSL